MRLINDRLENEETRGPGFLTALLYAMFTSLGVASVVLSPLPLIAAHLKLEDPWPKVVAVSGAAMALILFQMPLPAVILIFSLALFIADGVWKDKGLWAQLSHLILFALFAGLLLTGIGAWRESLSWGDFWVSAVDKLVAQTRDTLPPSYDIQWEVLRSLLLTEGPFLYISGVIFLFWFSVGLAAHLGWVGSLQGLSPQRLRSSSLPVWWSLLFVILFVANALAPALWHGLVSGALRIVTTLMFIQGTIFLSQTMRRRGVGRRTRALLYSGSIFLGFYALVALGALSPLVRKKWQMEEIR